MRKIDHKLEGIIDVDIRYDGRMDYYAKDEESYDELVELLQNQDYQPMGEQGKHFKRDHKDYWLVHHAFVEKAWLWSPIKPGPEAYKFILNKVNLDDRQSWYYKDIITPRIPAIRTIIEHFSTMNNDDIKLDQSNWESVIGDLAKQTGDEAYTNPPKHELTKFNEVYKAMHGNE